MTSLGRRREDIVGSFVVCSNVASNSWLGRKDMWLLSFQFAKFFCGIEGPCLCRRGKLFSAVSVFYYVCCFLQLFTLGARDFSSAVSGFCQVFIVTRGFGLRPKMCRPSANTVNSRRTREKTSGTQGSSYSPLL